MTAIALKNKNKRCLFRALALVVALCCGMNFAVFAEESSTQESQTTEETTKDEAYEELQNQYEELEQEMQANQEKLDAVQDDLNKQEDVVDSIYDKIDATQDEIDALAQSVDLLNSDISNTNKQIELIIQQLDSLEEQIETATIQVAEKEDELDEAYELLKQRVRAMYMAGNGSTIEFILTSDSFATLMLRVELLVRVAEHDNNLMEMLKSDIQALEELKITLSDSAAKQAEKQQSLSDKTQTLEDKKADVEQASDELEEKQAEIQQQYDEAKDQLNALDKESDEYKALISKQEAELLELSNEIEEYIKNSGSSSADKEETPEEKPGEDKEEENDNPYVDGNTPVSSSGMIFPLNVPNVYVSSPYGMRTHPITGEYKMHSGIDFSAPNGTVNLKPILAVKDGTVIFAGTRGGYGNYIIVDHGKGITSCYAHCSSISVTKGQTVKQGQTIGKVGDTGSSTAPHLHFEIRIDGATTNPANYIPMP